MSRFRFKSWLFAFLGLAGGLVVISAVAGARVWVVAATLALAIVGYLYGKHLDDNEPERPQDQSTGRQVAKRTVGIFFAAIAVALTVGFVIVVFQALTGDWNGGEAGIVWTIAGLVGVLTPAVWAVAIAILTSVQK